MSQKSDLKKFSPELKSLVTRLKNFGLIKKRVLKKGKLMSGVMQGRVEMFILTQEGKKKLKALTQLGF